jgi:peptide-methionine (S)-S-oxide reductase
MEQDGHSRHGCVSSPYTRVVNLRILLLAAAIAWGTVGTRGDAATVAQPARAGAPADTATFAGGCFWCMEAAFEALPGVFSVTSGFSGGPEKNPTYNQVSAGLTGHRESIQVVYDPKKITYAKLLDVYWHNIDPTQDDGQFCDRGKQYRSAIFFRGATQRRSAEASKRAIETSKRLKRPIVTPILPFTAFWPAEEYHQDYYKKNPEHYHAYRTGCGRDRRLLEVWGAEAPVHL